MHEVSPPTRKLSAERKEKPARRSVPTTVRGVARMHVGQPPAAACASFARSGCKHFSSYAPASFAQPAPEKQSSFCQRQTRSTLALAPRWAELARRKPWPCGSGDTHHLLELQAAASRSDPQASAEAQCQAQFAEQNQDHGASQEGPGA